MSYTKINNSRIQKWIKIIKKDLGIKCKIPVRSSRYKNCNPGWDGCIHLNKVPILIEINTQYLRDDYDIVSILAHEFRHAWQNIRGFYLYSKDDKKAEDDAKKYQKDFVRRYKKEMRCLKYDESFLLDSGMSVV